MSYNPLQNCHHAKCRYFLAIFANISQTGFCPHVTLRCCIEVTRKNLKDVLKGGNGCARCSTLQNPPSGRFRCCAVPGGVHRSHRRPSSMQPRNCKLMQLRLWGGICRRSASHAEVIQAREVCKSKQGCATSATGAQAWGPTH